MNLETLWKGRKRLLYSHDLIHCITNPISINDCANALLAIGAKPIMAQHPKESVEITEKAKALALNLGNFEDQRAQAMLLSASYAAQHKLPFILDLVGVGCSSLRYEYAIKMIHRYHPTVIKGNISELKAIAGKESHALGIDAGEKDQEALEISCAWLKETASKLKCCVLCTGKQDIVSDGNQVFVISNGHELLTRCTGTGCMLTVITAGFLAQLPAVSACAVACAYFGIAAERSYEQAKTPGAFHMALFDWLYQLDEATFYQMARIEESK